LRKCKNSSIDSSLGICYYLRDLNELNKFYEEINRVKTVSEDNFFIFLADCTPKYMKGSNEIKVIGNSIGTDDGF
jgi:hypothetical protein